MKKLELESIKQIAKRLGEIRFPYLAEPYGLKGDAEMVLAFRSQNKEVNEQRIRIDWEIEFCKNILEIIIEDNKE